MALKPAPSEDNFEMKAMKAMGAMEEGDAVFGSGSEVNLDSEVLLSLLSSVFINHEYQTKKMHFIPKKRSIKD